MSFNAAQFRQLIIKPSLVRLGLYSEAAENLVFGTAAVESSLGTYLKQLGSGPALGVCQMEPATHNDIWDNYLRFKPQMAARVRALMVSNDPQSSELVFNLYYSVSMCRMHYYRKKEPLPSAGDLSGLANYWKTHYNTIEGKGVAKDFESAYKHFSA